MIDFDVESLFLYFGDDYVINDKIKCSQPTIGQIVDYGEAFTLVVKPANSP